MPAEGFKVISIREGLHAKLHKQYEKEIKEEKYQPSFALWLSKLLEEELERRGAGK